MLSQLSTPEEINGINPKSLSELFESGTPTLATVKKYQGEAKSRAAIEYCLCAVNDFFGYKSGLSDGQLQMLSDLIYSEYYYMTLADLKYCIRQGLLGRYEDKIYGKATPDIIMRWLSVHSCERMNAAGQKSESDHNAKMKQVREDFENGSFESLEAANRAKQIREALEAKWNLKKGEKTFKSYYSTLEQYCEDLQHSTEVIRSRWHNEYIERKELHKVIDVDTFLSWKEADFLYSVNHPSPEDDQPF